MGKHFLGYKKNVVSMMDDFMIPHVGKINVFYIFPFKKNHKILFFPKGEFVVIGMKFYLPWIQKLHGS